MTRILSASPRVRKPTVQTIVCSLVCLLSGLLWTRGGSKADEKPPEKTLSVRTLNIVSKTGKIAMTLSTSEEGGARIGINDSKEDLRCMLGISKEAEMFLSFYHTDGSLDCVLRSQRNGFLAIKSFDHSVAEQPGEVGPALTATLKGTRLDLSWEPQEKSASLYLAENGEPTLQLSDEIRKLVRSIRLFPKTGGFEVRKEQAAPKK